MNDYWPVNMYAVNVVKGVTILQMQIYRNEHENMINHNHKEIIIEIPTHNKKAFAHIH